MFGLFKKKEKAQLFSIPQRVITNRGIIDIDKLKKGDKIVGSGGKINTVEKIDKSIQDGYFYVVNKNLIIYENQSIIANENCTHAKLLKKGDTIYRRDGSEEKIVNLKKIKGNYYFHRLTIGGDHTYYINDTLVHNASRYSVGTGSFNWDGATTTHWSATSGGSSGASVPSTTDDVFFNASSTTGTVTLTTNADILTLDFTGFTGTFAGSSNIQLRGTTFKFATGMTQSWTGDLTTVTAACVITSNGKSFGGAVNIGGTTPNLADDLTIPSTKKITFTPATSFNANNHNISAGAYRFENNGSGGYTVTMGSGTWTASGDNAGAGGGGYVWDASIAGGLNTLTSTGSTLKFTNTGNNAVWLVSGNKSLNNVWFSRGASTGDVVLRDPTATTLTGYYKDDGTGAHTMKIYSNTTLTCTSFIVSGNAGNLITITSDFNTTNTHTISVASGTVSCDYLNLQHSVATGGAGFYAGTHSTNNQGVATGGSGWIFTAPPVNTTMAVAVGTFTLTGIASLLHLGTKMTVAVGTFTLTGIANLLHLGRKMTVSVGTFTLTGIGILIKLGKGLVASVGTFTLTGKAILFHITVSIKAAVGTFTLTGINAILSFGHKMSVAVGTYTLTGISVLLHLGWKMAVAVGTFSLTGINILLKIGRAMAVAVGTYTLTGINLLFHLGRMMSVSVGTFTLTGISVVLNIGRKMAVSVATFTLTGVGVLFPRASKIAARVATFILTGYNSIGIFNGESTLWSAVAKSALSIWTGQTKN